MWYLNKIPKICHIYWGGGPMVYMRYLGIKTFIKHNPDWDIIFWYPKVPFKGKSWGIETGHCQFNPELVKDYFPEVFKLPIRKEEVDFGALKFGFDIAEVHKNDYIRINSLFLYGGAWIDTDIIFFKPIEELKINIPENKDIETVVCIGPYGHSTGINMACEDNKMFGVFLSMLTAEYRKRKYQCWGPDMFNKYFKTIGQINRITKAINLDMDVIYAHDIHDVNDLLDDIKPRFTDGSIGCHWYGGHSQWGDFMNKTKGGIVNIPDNLIGRLIKSVQ